ncbi:hypothetical protein RRG08_057531, partial [Elysia crispata]
GIDRSKVVWQGEVLAGQRWYGKVRYWQVKRWYGKVRYWQVKGGMARSEVGMASGQGEVLADQKENGKVKLRYWHVRGRLARLRGTMGTTGQHKVPRSGSCLGVQTRTRNRTRLVVRSALHLAEEIVSSGENCGKNTRCPCCGPRMWGHLVDSGEQPGQETSPSAESERDTGEGCEAAAMMVGQLLCPESCVAGRQCGQGNSAGQLLCPERCKGGNVDRETCTESMWNPWSHWSACEDRFGRLDNDTKQPCGDQSGQMKGDWPQKIFFGVAAGEAASGIAAAWVTIEHSIACQMKPCCDYYDCPRTVSFTEQSLSPGELHCDRQRGMARLSERGFLHSTSTIMIVQGLSFTEQSLVPENLHRHTERHGKTE